MGRLSVPHLPAWSASIASRRIPPGTKGCCKEGGARGEKSLKKREVRVPAGARVGDRGGHRSLSFVTVLDGAAIIGRAGVVPSLGLKMRCVASPDPTRPRFHRYPLIKGSCNANASSNERCI